MAWFVAGKREKGQWGFWLAQASRDLHLFGVDKCTLVFGPYQTEDKATEIKEWIESEFEKL